VELFWVESLLAVFVSLLELEQPASSRAAASAARNVIFM
jgi:hypothetical protein